MDSAHASADRTDRLIACFKGQSQFKPEVVLWHRSAGDMAFRQLVRAVSRHGAAWPGVQCKSMGGIPRLAPIASSAHRQGRDGGLSTKQCTPASSAEPRSRSCRRVWALGQSSSPDYLEARGQSIDHPGNRPGDRLQPTPGTAPPIWSWVSQGRAADCQPQMPFPALSWRPINPSAAMRSCTQPTRAAWCIATPAETQNLSP